MNPQSVDEITAITNALKEQKNIVQAYVMDEVFDKMEGRRGRHGALLRGRCHHDD